MSEMSAVTSHDLLVELYGAAVAAVAPGPALHAALARRAAPTDSPWLIALGKAALPMAAAATTALADLQMTPAGGLIVSPEPGEPPHPSLTLLAGDHPQPGDGSFAAAVALGALCMRIPADATVWVLLSGGTSALIGAPMPGVSRDSLHQLFANLLGSGLDIAAMNTIRKRFTRWGGGKLARALSGRSIAVFAVSDVNGDDLAAIGSGPCIPDPATAAAVRDLLSNAALLDSLAPDLRAVLDGPDAAASYETPKPGDPVFARVQTEVIASNRLALDAAANRAASLGLVPVLHSTPMAGEAADAGASVAAALKKYCADGGAQPALLIWGGETTVTLGVAPGLGGRNQELALAAAAALDGSNAPITVLAAGTDGRDGPTDAAGAIVTPSTWRAITTAGLDPAVALAAHNAYPALDAAGALLRPGMTGTNVMDVTFGLVGHPPHD